MESERALARFVAGFPLAEVPAEPLRMVRRIVMAVCGTAAAGAEEAGIAELRALLIERGGAPQATVLIHGDRLPAASAAMLNGTMCRALDFCDAMAPGPHIGSSLFPAAMAAAELRGGCSGAELLAALAMGAEVGARMNLTEAMYDGFDPTGVAVVFAATAAAARVLGLDEARTHHALALAFNRCAGSFQSNVDGSLAVRLIQGWTTEAAVTCAQLAQRGLTGPANFLEGHYGYAHLFGRGLLKAADVVDQLGAHWRIQRTMFKKFPSCGVTQGVTDLALRLAREHRLSADDVASGRVTLPPYAWRLVGHAFRLGESPRVDAQFNAGWCVANALVRGASRCATRRSSRSPVASRWSPIRRWTRAGTAPWISNCARATAARWRRDTTSRRAIRTTRCPTPNTRRVSPTAWTTRRGSSRARPSCVRPSKEWSP